MFHTGGEAHGARLPPEWRDALQKGHLAVVSAAPTASRLTQQQATARNALVGQLAHSMVVAHASPAGSLAAQVALWRQAGRQVQELVPV